MGTDLDLSGVLRPVREGNAFEETVERLLTVIKLGFVAPGDRFPAERELAAQLGISRLTLREAIGELQRAGYVESRRGRFGGTFSTYTRPAPNVGEIRRLAIEDGQKLTDALTFRFAVETGAADMLAQQLAGSAGPAVPAPRATAPAPARGADATGTDPRGTDPRGTDTPWPDTGGADDGSAVAASPRETLLARLADVNAASPQDYRRLDTLFHLSIAELTGSSLLTAASADARMRLNDLLNAIPVLKLNIEHAAAQHAAIVDAILAGDPERARTFVGEHLAATGALLRGFLG